MSAPCRESCLKRLARLAHMTLTECTLLPPTGSSVSGPQDLRRVRQAALGSLGLGELRTESTAKSVTGSDLCLSVSAQIPADLVGPALCLIDLSAGPDPDVLYGLMRRRRCPGWGTPEGIFTGRGIRDVPMRHGLASARFPLRVRLERRPARRGGRCPRWSDRPGWRVQPAKTAKPCRLPGRHGTGLREAP